jgi:hypothetical protein
MSLNGPIRRTDEPVGHKTLIFHHNTIAEMDCTSAGPPSRSAGVKFMERYDLLKLEIREGQT